MEILNSYNLIIAASIIIILSFLFNEISRKTNVPSVLMLIVLGIVLKIGMDSAGISNLNFLPILEVLGIVGLIMIVLEAALELELKPEKMIPIATALFIALAGLLLSAWVAAAILQYFIPEMSSLQAWMYATPLSILSSAIIIPSVSGLSLKKKEFHIYESTFSDILGIMLFYYLAAKVENGAESNGFGGFLITLFLTIAIAFIASYLIVFIFQNIKSQAKLFLLISVLLLLYAVSKQMHLSALLIILVFGLVIANLELFFKGRLSKWLHLEKANSVYEGLHEITVETAFVVRTFFFVIFGITITLSSLLSLKVALISGAIVVSIYAVRYALLRPILGKDILPQLFIAPRGLITILLFYNIPKQLETDLFDPGILLFIIITTSLLMTFALVWDKNRSIKAIKKATDVPVGFTNWKAPDIEEIGK
ncbi:MAG: sodium:proton exchanger [Saprospirales bacterium]|jgi:NhaP-type Na+/H+ or K+/H+ antiporter|nr:sodium:proton exchanger [Saprospirales bacterium]